MDGFGRSLLAIVVASAAIAHAAYAGQPLETETARIGTPGTLRVEAGFERQSASDGTEANVPIALEYVPTHRLALLLEPVPYSKIRGQRRTLAQGPGDLELTALLLARPETQLPAMAFAGEVKLPTASNRLIGSGRADYTGYLILSKRVASIDTHANIGYTIVGRPVGVNVQNVLSFALAAERPLRHLDWVAEVLGSTAALAEGGPQASPNGESTVAPEIGGQELIGTVGARYRLRDIWVLSLGVSYDNNNAVQVHPGLSVKLR